MHPTHHNPVLRDGARPGSIRPVIERNKLIFAETRGALIAPRVPRAAAIAAVATSN